MHKKPKEIVTQSELTKLQKQTLFNKHYQSHLVLGRYQAYLILDFI